MSFKIEKKYVTFAFLYFFTILFLLLDQLDNVPLMVQLRKFKYIYVGLLLAWYILSIKSNNAADRLMRKSNIVLFLCVIHTFFFGYIFTNNLVVSYTYIHARELLVYYLLVYLTLTYIYENKLILLYSLLTYAALAIQLIWALFTHLGDFVNPLTYWRIFSNTLRYRTDFGFVQYGYTANYCVFALVTSLLIFDILKRENRIKENAKALMAMCFIDIIIACMLCSTAGRSGVLSLLLIVGVYVIGCFISKMEEKKRRTIKIIIIVMLAISLVILFITGIFSSIWEDSNRDLNISINYPVFKKIGNIWTGMGYVENSEFQVGNHNNWTSIFGERTSSLDIYYLYLYFTTGIIGCILIGFALLYLLFNLIKNMRCSYGVFGFSLMIGWLFYAYWQCNMLTYRYYSPWFYLVVLLYILDNHKRSKESEFVNDKQKERNIKT